MSICVDTVVDVGHVPCNTSLSVDSSTPVIYVSGSVELDQSTVTPSQETTAMSPITVGCSVVARARPRQTLNLTVFSFGGSWTSGVSSGAVPALSRSDADGGAASAAAAAAAAAGHGRPQAAITGNGAAFAGTSTAVASASGGCPAQLLIVDGRRRHVSPLCPFRQQRERNVYQSHDSQVALYFQPTNRKQLQANINWLSSPIITRWTFVLKIEGNYCESCVIFCLFSKFTSDLSAKQPRHTHTHSL